MRRGAYARYPQEVIVAREKSGLISSEQNERGGVGNFLIEYPLVLREGLWGMKADMVRRPGRPGHDPSGVRGKGAVL